MAASFDLAIRGTDVSYSPMGLPAEMSGDVFRASGGAASRNPIGHYEEQLTPILMDVNGDQIPDFVGTQGVATFTFFVGTPQYVFGSITTANTSYIQGMEPTGQILVGSQGTIVATSGMMRNTTGGFVSQSTVALGPSFSMQTMVHFTVNRRIDPLLVLLTYAADYVAQHAESSGDRSTSDTAISPDQDGGADDRTLPDGGKERKHSSADHEREDKRRWGTDRDSARDSIFADNLDWRPGKSSKSLRSL